MSLCFGTMELWLRLIGLRDRRYVVMAQTKTFISYPLVEPLGQSTTITTTTTIKIRNKDDDGKKAKNSLTAQFKFNSGL